jgi:hypothetical protein
MSGHDQERETGLEQPLARWMVDEAPSHARPGLLGEVLDQTRAARQLGRHAWWPGVAGPRTGLPRFMTAALVTGLVVVIGFGAVLIGGRLADQGAGTGVPSAVPASPPMASPEASPRPASAGALDPSVPYSFDLPVPFTFRVPAGWAYGYTGPNGSTIGNDRQTAFLGWFVTDNLYRDPCHWQKGLLEPPLGPGVNDLVGALGKLPGFVITGPTPTSIGGLPAQSLTVVPQVRDTACDGGQIKVWSWTPTGGEAPLSGGTTTVGVVNVGGTRLIVTSWTSLSDLAATTSDVAAIVRSIQFR